MDKEIKKLVDSTTIIGIDNNKTGKVEFGDKYPTSRYDKNHLMNYTKLQQIDLEELEEYWNKKWDFFDNKWNEERQNYRFFYDTFQLFYYSFYQLKLNKLQSLGTFKDKKKKFSYNRLAGVNLYGVYNYGKKCVDLIKILKLCGVLDKNEKKFVTKFAETRNKLMEHNFNPHGFKLKIDPWIWSITATNSFMDIIIHGQREREYDARIDYYEDCYRLENILVKIIKRF